MTRFGYRVRMEEKSTRL